MRSQSSTSFNQSRGAAARLASVVAAVSLLATACSSDDKSGSNLPPVELEDRAASDSPEEPAVEPAATVPASPAAAGGSAEAAESAAPADAQVGSVSEAASVGDIAAPAPTSAGIEPPPVDPNAMVDASVDVSSTIRYADVVASPADASLRLAQDVLVASFADVLRNGPWSQALSAEALEQNIKALAKRLDDDQLTEFGELVATWRMLTGR